MQVKCFIKCFKFERGVQSASALRFNRSGRYKNSIAVRGLSHYSIVSLYHDNIDLG